MTKKYNPEDLIEWKIVTTSDKCWYEVKIHEFDCVGSNCQSIPRSETSKQCDHPNNASRTCLKSICPIKEK